MYKVLTGENLFISKNESMKINDAQKKFVKLMHCELKMYVTAIND